MENKEENLYDIIKYGSSKTTVKGNRKVICQHIQYLQVLMDVVKHQSINK